MQAMSKASKPTPIRVLTRPQSSPTLNSPRAKATPFPLPPPAEGPSFPDTVVVIGFIGGRSDDVSQLVNRIVDANVFGSGGVDRSFVIGEQEEELRRWLRWHRIRYYHEVERGIVYLQFVDKDLLELVDEEMEFGDVVEEWELGSLQGMLLMFSVCHVLVLVQEGSRFSTQVLKKLRVLQAAKNAMSPFLRSQIASSGTGMPHPVSFSNYPDSVSSSKNPSPGRSSGGMRRNASSFSGVSGLGSSTSMFPGNCTPVVLFVFVDDFSNLVPSISALEVTTDKSFVQSANLISPDRPGLPIKGAGSVVVLARPAAKSEQSPHKKLQSSLESQIRFLVKKSKLQIGPERSRSGLRSGGVFPTPTPLLSLDASKAVILVDKVSSQTGKSLEFACSLVDKILKGKATSDALLLENHGQMAYQDDLKSLKDFIVRQCDIYRGRGASPSTGVGMIAAAAVAAATSSASSGKSVAVPELPNFKSWLSFSQLILRGLLSSRSVCLDVMESCTSHSHENPVASEMNDKKSIEAANTVVALLESGTFLNSKFSNLWCQRLLSAAKDIYLQDMPSCYPTRLHETQLQKALSAFHSMVKGPAVEMFSKKLQEECMLVWKSGRQLCDAVSLTGKPCVHQKHDLCTHPQASDATASSHCSGFVFLHACACGRSRFLRPDPFDFETANSSSLCPVECGKLSNGLQLPQTSSGGIGKTAGWSLLRIGAASYYDPSTGLLQSGFDTSQKYLFSWIILHETPNFLKVAPLASGSTVALNFFGTPDVEPIKDNVVRLYQRDKPEGVIIQRRSHVSNKFDGKIVNTVRELPISTNKKPFSEIVAGSAASDTDFPPLKHNKQVVLGTGKGLKQSEAANRNVLKVHVDSSLQDPHRKSDTVGQQDDVSSLINDKDNWPHLQIGNNTISANLNVSEKSQIKQVVLYVGFEYECSHGHRFILSPEHLLELGLLNTAFEESRSNSIRKVNIRFSGSENGLKSSSPSKAHQQPFEINSNVHRGRRNGKLKEKNPFKSRERMSTGESHIYHGAPSGNDHHYHQRSMSLQLQPAKNVVENLKSDSLDSRTSAIALLNTNLPVYIICPHCSNSKHKEDAENVKFASTTSQLQRIFMVTPPLPVVIATCPVVQHETSCLPPSVPNREEMLQFSPACDVILPPESFIVLRLPFIYGIQMEDGNSHPLSPFESQPELTAWLVKGTALRVVSGGCSNSG